MEIFADGRIYLARGEHFPFQCPNCEHIMEWTRHGMLTCEKCDFTGTAEEFSKVAWKLMKAN